MVPMATKIFYSCHSNHGNRGIPIATEVHIYTVARETKRPPLLLLKSKYPQGCHENHRKPTLQISSSNCQSKTMKMSETTGRKSNHKFSSKDRNIKSKVKNNYTYESAYVSGNECPKYRNRATRPNVDKINSLP